jgi:hypothetical protein
MLAEPVRLLSFRRVRRLDTLPTVRMREHGQVDVEARSLRNAALYGDLAAVLGYDAVDHRETEAGTFANWLCGEERLEDALHRRFVHTAAGIAHGEPHTQHWWADAVIHGKRKGRRAEPDSDSAHPVANRSAQH